ncbi:MAG: hypothetical protein ABI782_04635 [Anaerolineaceae bacterium]
MDHFTHQVLSEQREERLARKIARCEAIGYQGIGRPSVRQSVASLLRTIANRLAPQAEPADPATTPNHVHIRPRAQEQIRSEG